jgi:hypothetical protein
MATSPSPGMCHLPSERALSAASNPILPGGFFYYLTTSPAHTCSPRPGGLTIIFTCVAHLLGTRHAGTFHMD